MLLEHQAAGRIVVYILQHFGQGNGRVPWLLTKEGRVSSKNNVNKDHYTQAGRDRPNENIVHSDHKEGLTRAEKRIATGEAAAPKGNKPKVQPTETGLVHEQTVQVPEGAAAEAARREEEEG